MPRILYRYILREVLYPSVLALVGLTMILLLAARAPGFRDEHLAFMLMRMFFRPDVPNGELLYVLGAMLPTLMMFITPMALLIGILIGVGRMTLDLEVRAMQTGGIPLYILFLPILGVAAFCSLFIAFMNFAPEPLMIRGSMSRVARLLVSEFSNLEAGRVYDEIFGDDSGMNLYFDDRDPETNHMMGITLLVDRDEFVEDENKEAMKDFQKIERRRLMALREAGVVTREEMDRRLYDIEVARKEQDPVFIFASSARFDADPDNGRVELELLDGTMHLLESAKDETDGIELTPHDPDAPTQASMTPPPSDSVDPPPSVTVASPASPASAAATTPSDNPAATAGTGPNPAIAANRQYVILKFGRMRKTEYLGGFDADDDRRTQTVPELMHTFRNAERERLQLVAKATMLERLSGSLQCLVLAFIGLPLAVSVRPSGKSIGIIIAFALILIYQWILRTGYTMVESAHPLGLLMIFMPNLLFIVAGLFLWRQSLRA